MLKAKVEKKNLSWTIEMHPSYRELQKSFNNKHNGMDRVKIYFDPKWFYLKYHNRD